MIKGFFDKYVLADDPTSPAPAPAAPANTAPMGAVPSTVVNTNNEFVTALRNAIKARQTAFTALLAAADKLANIIPDPITRLKAAFATVSGEGRGIREVLGAIEVHIADLESQRMQFSRALEGQKQQAIGTLQHELDNIKPANDSAMAQIQSMTEQIGQLQQLVQNNNLRAGELQTKIATEGARFTASAQQFETALVLVKSELDGQKAAVTSTLS